MVTLRRFSRIAIEQIARDLIKRRQDKLIGDLDYALELTQYHFRDSSNTYWYYSVSRQSWFVYSDDNWEINQAIPECFEAPDLPTFTIMSDLPKNEEETELDTKENAENISSELQNNIKKIINSYKNGLLNTDAVERMRRQQILVGKTGDFWTLGIESKNWYRYFEGKWQVNEVPPEENIIFHSQEAPLSCSSCGETIDKGIFCSFCGAKNEPISSALSEESLAALTGFLMFGLSNLPESISIPWDPPGSFPENSINAYFICWNCEQKIPLESKYCNNCGAALKSKNKKNINSTIDLPTKECSKCNEMLPENTKFCISCGEKAEVTNPTSTNCDECGHECKLDEKFCTNCGERLNNF